MEPHLERLSIAIASAIRGMTPEDLARHPAGKWSAGEVLEHLSRTYTGTVKGLERCLQAGRPLATSPTRPQRIAAAVTVGLGIMPGKREAPSYTLPQGVPVEKVIAEIGPQIAAMDAILSQCEARYGKRVKLLDHKILGPLTGEQWRKFHWVHGRHHIKQIMRLRASREQIRP